MKKRVLIFLVSAFALIMLISSCAPSLQWFIAPKTVLIDDTHNNSYNFDGYGGAAFYAKLSTILQSMGYSVAFTSSAGFVPENYGVFLAAAPVNAYSNSEMQKVANFLSKCNRKLILLGEWYGYYDNTPLNSLLTYLGSGISFNNKEVFDDTNNYNSTSYWPVISDFEVHPVTTGLSTVVLFATTTLNVTGSAVALAYPSATAYVTAPSMVSGNNSSYSPSSESFELEIIIDPIIVMAAEEVKRGKIVAIGDATLFANDVYNSLTDDFIDIAENTKLLKNIINW
ncbi:hypothetical protein AT15_05385 [Kosmotoga arenicorallina S304]|uniref:Uncharacterized protein n=1 Tax=Kosmotoga arenicorallina S304 TaxID=1453497 RepID=A0A176K3B4_9BACT|nr:hypothetical protein [Kosmotoga arenicorallina]OAA31506.1 hypothetical protein AT15_05385 [Kosmotoga arenicorallina S304]